MAMSLLYDNTVTAYVDESGNHDLAVEKSGATNLYVCVAVMVDGQQIDAAKAGMREISKKYFGGQEVHSSSVGSDHKRRARLLEQVSDIDFGYYALIVDKARMFRDSGLKYKTSFYKYLHLEFYRRILSSGMSLHVVADHHGGKAFMDSLQPYLAKKGLPNLFSKFTHEFADSNSEPLVQLADLIAGSLTYIYDPDKKGEHSAEFKTLLDSKQTGIGGWPFVASHRTTEETDEDDVWDDIIRAACINRADSFEREFIDKGDENRDMQIATLRHLIFLKECGDNTNDDSIYADALIQHLKKLQFPVLNRQTFSSRVIGPLRDSGIILAGDHDGYRLATSVDDIRTYLSHTLSIVEPMMARLKMARENIRQATSNRLDILGFPDYKCLAELMSAFEQYRMSLIVASNSLDSDCMDNGDTVMIDFQAQKKGTVTE